MSRIELICQTIGVSAVVLSSCMASATAQTMSKLPKEHSASTLTNLQSQEELHQEQPKISTREDINTSSSREISQARETDGVPETDRSPENDGAPETDQAPESNQAPETNPYSELQKLEQDPNRLKLPSAPEEVEIDINQPITLEQALALALRNNKDLETARLDLARAQREIQEARADLYPDLSFETNFENSQTAQVNLANQRARLRSTTTVFEEGSENEFNGTLSLNYDVYTGGRRGSNINRAERTLELNELTVEQITEQTLFEAARDYFELQNSGAQVDIAAAAVEDAQQTLKDAQLLEQAGLGTRFDVLRAEVELANADQQLITAIANQKTARRQLAETLSLAQQVNLETADDIEEIGVWNLSLEESIVLGYQQRAELNQFLVQKEINQQERQIAFSQIRPQVNIFTDYELLEVLDDNVGLQDGYRVGATLRWAIFDGGTARARARQEDVDILNSQTGFANQRNQVRIEVERSYFSLQANKENITTAEKAVELAEESLRLARLRFQAGVGTQTDVIESQTELTTARGNRLDAIIQYNQSLNQLYRAVNGLAPLNQILNP